MGFREPQQAVDRWIGQFEEGYWPPLTILARLTEEVGELSRELNHRFGAKPKKGLANSQRIDLDAAFADMLTKVTARDADRWTRKAR